MSTLIKPIQLSLRLGISWLLPAALSIQACLVTSLDNSHKQYPGAIWRVRSQPRSMGLFGLNTPCQVHLNLCGKPQRASNFQTPGCNRGICSCCLSPQTSPESAPLPAGIGDKGTCIIAHTVSHWAVLRDEHSALDIQHSAEIQLILAWAFKKQG